MQLYYMRFPGVMLGADEVPIASVLRMVAGPLKVPADAWSRYGERAETRREPLLELQTVFGFQCLIALT